MAATAAMVSSAALASSRSAVHGSGFSSKTCSVKSPAAPRGVVSCTCKASTDSESEQVSRRLALALAAGALAVTGKVSSANAAYGEAANVFGAPKKDSGFTPYSGDGFSVSLPSKWNPSKEKEFPGTLLRYEDNFDQKSNLAVMVLPTDKKAITDFGSPESFLESFNYLLGKQIYSGKTVSEGGFDPNAVATASLLTSKTKDVGGKKYYDLEVLTRTADGDEGGTHHLIVATVDGGKLYLLKAQAGDKRWFKGAQKFVKGVADSFSVA